MTIAVVTLELGVVSLPDWHPRSADTTCLIQGLEDVHDESWMAPACESIERLMSFDPDVVQLSHDRAIWSKQP